MFEYWKAVYLLVGDNFDAGFVYGDQSPYIDTLSKLWDELDRKYKDDGYTSWTTNNAPIEEQKMAYAIYNKKKDIYQFTEKFYKELDK